MGQFWSVCVALLVLSCASVPAVPDTEQLAGLANDVRVAYESGRALVEQAKTAIDSAKRDADGGVCVPALAASRVAQSAANGAMALAFLAKRACSLVPEAEACAAVGSFADDALEVTGTVTVLASSVEAKCASVEASGG